MPSAQNDNKIASPGPALSAMKDLFDLRVARRTPSPAIAFFIQHSGEIVCEELSSVFEAQTASGLCVRRYPCTKQLVCLDLQRDFYGQLMEKHINPWAGDDIDKTGAAFIDCVEAPAIDMPWVRPLPARKPAQLVAETVPGQP